VDNFDELIYNAIIKRKTTKEPYEELFERLFNKKISSTEARKRLKGIENMLRQKKDENTQESEINSFYTNLSNEEEQEHKILAEEYTKLRKRYQNSLDKLRVERKYNRKDARNETILDGIKNIFRGIEKFEYDRDFNPSGCISFGKPVIAHQGDAHFNEFILNKYNFKIAKQMMVDYYNKIMNWAVLKETKHIIIATTGDMFNLDSHMDKKLTNETTRGKAVLEGFKIFSHCIDEMLNRGFKVSYVGVVGNEGRIKGDEFMTNEEELATDNFDYILASMLWARYSGKIEFINMCDSLEFVLTVDGKNILLTHGHKLNQKQLDKEIANIKVRYFEEKGILIHYILISHIHDPLITSKVSRSGSLVGGNSFSSFALNIPSSVSCQNVLFVEDDHITGMPIILRKG